MNQYKISDLYVGQKELFHFDVTEEKMKGFLELTGDTNPLHTDEGFAKETLI